MSDKENKGAKDPGAPSEPSVFDLPGSKPLKVEPHAPAAKAEKEYKKEGPQKKVAWGDKKPKPEDANKPKSADADKAKERGKSSAEIGTKAAATKTVADMVWATTREGEEDKTYAETTSLKVDAEALAASFDAKELQGKATLLKLKAGFTAAHAQIDLADVIGKFLFGDRKEAQTLPSGPMTPMAARVMDLTSHGVPCAPGPGSTNVFIGGMPALRATLDQMLCTAPGMGSHGGGPFVVGDPTVLINNMPAIRVGDFVAEPNGGPNMIVVGCPTVMIGMPAAAPELPVPTKKGDELPWVIFESVAKVDVGTAEAEAKGEAKYDLKKGQLKIEGGFGASAAAVKAELPVKVRLRIPFTSAYLGLGVTAAGTLGSAGVEVHGAVKVNDVDQETGKTTWFGVTGGGGANAGVGGASLKFSLDVSSK